METNTDIYFKQLRECIYTIIFGDHSKAEEMIKSFLKQSALTVSDDLVDAIGCVGGAIELLCRMDRDNPQTIARALNSIDREES
jgi:hypothetical protein